MSNQEEEYYIINDLENFVESARVMVYDMFGKQEQKNDEIEFKYSLKELSKEDSNELDSVLSQSEATTIAKPFLKKQKHKITNIERFIISNEKFLEMIEALNSRLISNLLNYLANKGLIESAYDEKINDFIFWINDETDENDEEIQKPETD